MSIADKSSNSSLALRITAVACLHDSVKVFYQVANPDSPDSIQLEDQMPEKDKEFLKEHIIGAISDNYEDKSIRLTYQQMLEKIVAWDYPSKWQGLPLQTVKKLNSCQKVEELFGGLSAVHVLVII